MALLHERWVLYGITSPILSLKQVAKLKWDAVDGDFFFY
jgi:hypothetical protein